VSLFAGGEKVWYRDVFLLRDPDSQWQRVDSLAGPLAYGASVPTPEGLVLVGGSDGKQHFPTVRLVSLSEGRLVWHSLPDLPVPVANLGAAYLDGKIYAGGGQTSPHAVRALRDLWVLNLTPQPAGKRYRRCRDRAASSR
ncbi:MAG: hypothetical protein GXO73_03900, partial [Calditrichaeota bacterium]|nr:hypothetical protein [Calditrichota bacterium]